MSPDSNSSPSRSSFSDPPDDLLPTPAHVPDVSFIAIIEAGKDATWLFLSESVIDLLGWEPEDLIGSSPFELMHPHEREAVENMHFETVAKDKAAAVAFLRFRHKRGHYVLCKITRSVVHTALIGSVSAATENDSSRSATATAEDVEYISPDAKRYSFRKWIDDTPPISFPLAPYARKTGVTSINDLSRELQFASLKPSPRAGLILNRFSLGCVILYCTNDLILNPRLVRGRFFFDFVHPEWQETVAGWLDTVKGWAKSSPDGPPSDGGFYFGRFRIVPQGRHAEIGQSTSTKKRGKVEGGRHGSAKHTSSSRQMPGSSTWRRKISPVAAAAAKPDPEEEQHWVDGIFSAHSDGLIVILRNCLQPDKQEDRVPPSPAPSNR